MTFRDEPGEGSGVARSFYTAFCQAILSAEKLPNLEPALVGSKSLQYSKMFACFVYIILLLLLLLLLIAGEEATSN